MTNILTVVGARPQFVKAAVISRLIRSHDYSADFREYLVHTGQHYDDNMSDVFFREMLIPEPDANLGISGGRHGAMTGEMLVRLEEVMLDRKPDIVLLYGDTNSTLAGALASAKLGIPVAHVESGLRGYDKTVPEEINRLVTDHLSAWLLCPTETAVRNLLREGIGQPEKSASDPSHPTNDRPQVVNTGDIMLDACLVYRKVSLDRPEGERAAARLGLDGPFRLLTLHRAENTDNRDRLTSVVDALNRADDMPIVFPIHPRTRKFLSAYGLTLSPHVRVIDPVGYFDILELEDRCEAILTDSGGVQREAYFLGKPCVTLRERTEWVETAETGWNTVTGVNPESILGALGQKPPLQRPPVFGDGRAGSHILDLLRQYKP